METTDNKHEERCCWMLARWALCLWQAREQSYNTQQGRFDPSHRLLIYASGCCRVNSLGDELASQRARNVWEERCSVNAPHSTALRCLQAQRHQFWLHTPSLPPAWNTGWHQARHRNHVPKPTSPISKRPTRFLTSLTQHLSTIRNVISLKLHLKPS